MCKALCQGKFKETMTARVKSMEPKDLEIRN